MPLLGQALGGQVHLGPGQLQGRGRVLGTPASLAHLAYSYHCHRALQALLVTLWRLPGLPTEGGNRQIHLRSFRDRSSLMRRGQEGRGAGGRVGLGSLVLQHRPLGDHRPVWPCGAGAGPRRAGSKDAIL